MPRAKAAGSTGGGTANKAKKASRTPKRPAQSAAGAKLRIKQVRSGIGHAETYRLTLHALGLHYHQAESVVPDGPSTRGMLRKVSHLVRVLGEES